MRLIGETIVSAIATRDDPAEQARLATVVHDICARFPVPGLRED
jgi:HD superfamily phosphohydrolase YqeK